MTFPWLSLIVFLPAAGAVIIAVFLRGVRTIRWTAALFSGATLVLTLLLAANFNLANAMLPQFVEKAAWLPQIHVQYFLGVDGLSVPLVALTGILGFCAVLASWSISTRVREYFLWLLLLETGVMGVFTSLDFLMFFLFWEVELVPMFLLISIWGTGRKEYSAMKFLIYTIAGSAFMLIGILALYFSAGTFDMTELGKATLQPVLLSAQAIFFLIFLAFAIKLPIWPLHTWLPDAHTDAPTAVSIMLAGVLLKMGGYGMLRISLTIMPDVAKQWAWLLVALAVVNVLYGAAVTLRQTDLKKMIAYSSVSHMGYVLLGLASLGQVGLTGASLQMFTHGTITGLLFLMVGVTYERTHTRQIPEMGGLAKHMPIIAVGFVLAGLASLGLPSMSGFVAELTVFMGAFPQWSVATILAIFGVVLSAGYILWMLQRVFFGPEGGHFHDLRDARPVEVLAILVLLVPIFIIGVYPTLLTNYFNAGVMPIVTRLGQL